MLAEKHASSNVVTNIHAHIQPFSDLVELSRVVYVDQPYICAFLSNITDYLG